MKYKKSIKILSVCILIIMLVISFLYVKSNKKSKDVNKPSTTQKLNESKTDNIILHKNDYIVFGIYLDEPILWEVINIDKDGKPLLFSEKILCFKSFDACNTDKKSKNKFGSSNWDNCTLNIWLNSNDKKVNYDNKIPNKKSVYQGYNAYDKEPGFLCSNNFKDKEIDFISSNDVFILSKKQINKYIPKKNRVKKCTNSAITNNNSHYIYSKNTRTWYWTSSPIKSNNSSVCSVNSSGGFYKSLAYDSIMGVCPSLYLKSTNIISCSGNGSKNNPYQFYSEMNKNEK